MIDDGSISSVIAFELASEVLRKLMFSGSANLSSSSNLRIQTASLPANESAMSSDSNVDAAVNVWSFDRQETMQPKR